MEEHRAVWNTEEHRAVMENSTVNLNVIKWLRWIFATHEILAEFVSHNSMSHYNSYLFEFDVTASSSLLPKGAARSSVCMQEDALRKQLLQDYSNFIMDHYLAKLLRKYHSVPQATTI